MGRDRARLRRSSAALAIPRETLTSSPPPGRPPAGPSTARPCSRTGPSAPPCAPTPGTRNARPGAIARIAASSSGAVAPTTSPTVPPGPQCGDPSRDATVERLDGRVERRRPPATCEVLQLAGPGVGRPAQDVGEPVRSLEQRRDRLGAEVRVDGHRVRAEDVEQGGRLPGRRRADVAALRVGDDRQVRGQASPGSAPGPPSRPTRRPRRTRGSA